MSYWPDRRVLVTGGAGFIGRHLVAELVARGARVVIADTFERAPAAAMAGAGERTRIVAGDLREPANCARACQDVELVFHLACKVGSSEFYRRSAAEVVLHNLVLDAQMLEAARRAKIRRYVYASSAFVYPVELQRDPAAPAMREPQAYPADPPNAYGWAKLIAERALEYAVAQDDGFRAGVLRLSGVYGPGQSIDLERGSVIPVLVRRAVEYPALAPFTIRGSGTETRTFCYVSDIVRAMLCSAEKLEQWPLLGPLNLGSEKRIRIVDLARTIVRLSGKDIPVNSIPAPAPLAQSQSLDCSRARELLDGWTPEVGLEEGLLRVLRDQQAAHRNY